MKYRENIIKKVEKIQQKNGIYYATTDGKLYKTVKVLYVLAIVYTLVMNFSYITGNLIMLSLNQNLKVDYNPLITVSVLTVLLVFALVIMGLKKHIWSNCITGLLNLFVPCALIFTFANLLSDVSGLWGFAYNFYWRHAVPLVLTAVLGVWASAIALRANIKLNKSYKKVIENIYNQFKNESLSEEDWEEYLKNYNV